jgi:hypothetical protein
MRSLPKGSTLDALNKACKGRKSLDGIKDIERLFYGLVSGGNCREIPAPRTGKAGRPKSPTIELHPTLCIHKKPKPEPEPYLRDLVDAEYLEEVVDDGLPF